MYRHLLIATDGSDLSAKAIDQGIMLAKTLKARMTAITVFPRFHTFAVDPMAVTDTPAQYQKDCDALGEKRLSSVRAAALAAGVRCDGVVVMHDDPYQAIIDAARETGCDLIVMASHGRRGVSALVLGSETTKVLTHSRIPVLVCR